jgi:hypothetical protein
LDLVDHMDLWNLWRLLFCIVDLVHRLDRYHLSYQMDLHYRLGLVDRIDLVDLVRQ